MYKYEIKTCPKKQPISDHVKLDCYISWPRDTSAWPESREQSRIQTRGKNWRLQIILLCSKSLRGSSSHSEAKSKSLSWPRVPMWSGCPPPSSLPTLLHLLRASFLIFRHVLWVDPGTNSISALNVLSSNICIMHCLISWSFYVYFIVHLCFLNSGLYSFLSSYLFWNNALLFKPLNVGLIYYLAITYWNTKEKQFLHKEATLRSPRSFS